VGGLSDIEEKLVRKGTLRKDGVWHKGLRAETRRREWAMMVRAVGCQVGSRAEGERPEASGKGKRSSSLEPLATGRPKAVIQFTGGSL
jgi:hypothetical protein